MTLRLIGSARRAALRVHTHVSNIYIYIYTHDPIHKRLTRQLFLVVSLVFLSFSLHSCSSLHVLAFFFSLVLHEIYDRAPFDLMHLQHFSNLLEIDSCIVRISFFTGIRFLAMLIEPSSLLAK